MPVLWFSCRYVKGFLERSRNASEFSASSAVAYFDDPISQWRYSFRPIQNIRKYTPRILHTFLIFGRMSYDQFDALHAVLQGAQPQRGVRVDELADEALAVRVAAPVSEAGAGGEQQHTAG